MTNQKQIDQIEQNNTILKKLNRVELQFRFFFKNTEQILRNDTPVEEKELWKQNIERTFNNLVKNLRDNILEINNHLNKQ
jgi:hypothetical protein